MRPQPRSPLWQARAALRLVVLSVALLLMPFGAHSAMTTGTDNSDRSHSVHDGGTDRAMAAGHDCCSAQGCMPMAILPDAHATEPTFSPGRHRLPAVATITTWYPAPSPPIPIPGTLT
jgi:hypothetical protein